MNGTYSRVHAFGEVRKLLKHEPGWTERGVQYDSLRGLVPNYAKRYESSTMLQPWIVGDAHYECAQSVRAQLQRYDQLQDIIAILGLDELSEEDRLVVNRARKLERFMSQPFFVAGPVTVWISRPPQRWPKALVVMNS